MRNLLCLFILPLAMSCKPRSHNAFQTEEDYQLVQQVISVLRHNNSPMEIAMHTRMIYTSETLDHNPSLLLAPYVGFTSTYWDTTKITNVQWVDWAEWEEWKTQCDDTLLPQNRNNMNTRNEVQCVSFPVYDLLTQTAVIKVYHATCRTFCGTNAMNTFVFQRKGQSWELEIL
jgi:hypothetical protein